MDHGGPEEWRTATREQERRLWSTLCLVGAVLTLVLASSILVAVLASDPPAVWFLAQQCLFLALSALGTAAAMRRRRSSAR